MNKFKSTALRSLAKTEQHVAVSDLKFATPATYRKLSEFTG